MKLKNIYSEIPSILKHEKFDQLIENDGVRIERIISKGHKSPKSGWHDQEENEWVLVLKGKAIVSFEDQKTIYLSAGDFINIPSHTRHRVDWTDPNQETIWLAVHY